MAYDIPATTMAQLAGSSAGAPDAKKFGADLTSGIITGGKQKRLNAEEYANQSAFGPGDISGAMRTQSNIMFKPEPIPGVVPDLSGKTKDKEWKMPNQKKQVDSPLAPSTAVSIGGTAAAPAAAPTATASVSGGGDDGPKDIDYTNTSDEYWKEIARSGRASEVWIPNLEKKGGAEAVSTVAKKYISGLTGSNWGTSSQSTASKKAINTATRHRGTGALLASNAGTDTRVAASPAASPAPAPAPARRRRTNREIQNDPGPSSTPQRDTYGGSGWYSDR